MLGKYFFVTVISIVSLIGCQTIPMFQKNSIRTVIKAHRTEFVQCSCKQRQAVANPEGRVTFNWKIDSQGKVSDARVLKSEIGSPSLEACILEELSKLTFEPAPAGGGYEVTYPFQFRNQAIERREDSGETIRCSEQ